MAQVAGFEELSVERVRKGNAMHASVGDRIVIHGHHVGEPDRDCEVLAVKGADGAAPYVVRWGDDGHESLFFPGTDAGVEHFDHGRRRRSGRGAK